MERTNLAASCSVTRSAPDARIIASSRSVSGLSNQRLKLSTVRPTGPGAGSLAQVVNAAIASKPRFDEMKAFFAGVGEGFAAGVWQDVPQDRVEFRDRYRRQLAAQAKKRAAEEMA